MSDRNKSSFRIKTLSELSRSIEVQLATAEYNQQINSEVARYARSVRIKGFRPGKAPAEMIHRLHKKEIEDGARQNLLDRYFRQAIQQAELRPEGVQIKEVKPPSKKHAGIYQITFEIMPEFDLSRLQNLSCTLYKGAVDDEDMEQALEDLRQRNIQWVDTDPKQAARKGHKVFIQYQLEVEGKKIEPPRSPTESQQAAAKPMQMEIVLGEKAVLPELADALYGTHIGDQKQVEMVFPEDFSSPELVGKSAVFTIKVDRVMDSLSITIDDNFANLINPGGQGGLSRLNETIRHYLEREIARCGRSINQKRVRELLLKQCALTLPPKLVDQHTQQWLAKLRQPEASASMRASAADTQKIEQQIRSEMTLGVIFSKVIKHHNLKVDQKQVADLIMADVQLTDRPKANFKRISASDQERRRYERVVIENMVFDHIIGTIASDYQTVNLRRMRELEREP